jgi:hypothetical protein
MSAPLRVNLAFPAPRRPMVYWARGRAGASAGEASSGRVQRRREMIESLSRTLMAGRRAIAFTPDNEPPNRDSPTAP